MIVNYNSWPDVARLVAGLAAAPEVAAGTCRIVVVDNASAEPPPPGLEQAGGVRLVPRRDNGGFAAGVNAGWDASESPWLLLLNPDVVAGADLPGRVLRRIERDRSRPEGSPGIVGFALRNADGTRQPSVGALPSLARSLWEPLIPRSRRKYQAGWRTRTGRVPWVTGACMLVNAALLRDLGGMDEDFFLYYEEVALCRAAALRGWSVEFDPAVEVVHLRPLQQRRVPAPLRVITRHSKLLYFRKYLPRWQFVGLTRVVAAEAAVRCLWASLRGRAASRRAWRTIEAMARAMRHGAIPKGRDVLALAQGHAGPTMLISDSHCPRERTRVRAPALATPPSPRPSPGGRGGENPVPSRPEAG